jgi:hypothetical protein
MPPAFNLSQDQTLQFDLELLIKELKKLVTSSIQSSWAFKVHKTLNRRFWQLGSWHSPSNAHAYRLLIFKEQQQAVACCVALKSVISTEAELWAAFKTLSSSRLSRLVSPFAYRLCRTPL